MASDGRYQAAYELLCKKHGRPPTQNELADMVCADNTAVSAWGQKNQMQFTPAIHGVNEAMIRKGVEAYQKKHGCLPSAKELAADLGMSYSVAYARAKLYNVELRRDGTNVHGRGYWDGKIKEPYNALTAELGRAPSMAELGQRLNTSPNNLKAAAQKAGLEFSNGRRYNRVITERKRQRKAEQQSAPPKRPKVQLNVWTVIHEGAVPDGGPLTKEQRIVAALGARIVEPRRAQPDWTLWAGKTVSLETCPICGARITVRPKTHPWYCVGSNHKVVFFCSDICARG